MCVLYTCVVHILTFDKVIMHDTNHHLNILMCMQEALLKQRLILQRLRLSNAISCLHGAALT